MYGLKVKKGAEALYFKNITVQGNFVVKVFRKIVIRPQEPIYSHIVEGDLSMKVINND